jgi:hypothetical protein
VSLHSHLQLPGIWQSVRSGRISGRRGGNIAKGLRSIKYGGFIKEGEFLDVKTDYPLERYSIL